MPNQIRGKILQIGATQNLTSKGGNQFSKRELVLDCTTYDQFTSEPRVNYPSFTFMSKHVTELDNFQVGQQVVVSFFISGRAWVKDGVTKYLNDVVGYKVEPVQAQQAPPQPQPQATAQGQQAPRPQPQSNPPFPPNVDASGAPIENTDDLPF